MLLYILDGMGNGNIHIRDVYHCSSSITDKPHLHIVIATGQFLLYGNPGVVMAICTSHTPDRLEELLTYRNIGDIVILEENEYEHLTRKTMIDCGRVHVMSPEEFIRAERKTPISVEIHTKIINTVLSIKRIQSPVRHACMNARGR